MVDLQAVRAEIARQREIEAKATEKWDEFGNPFDVCYMKDFPSDCDEGMTARNSHRALLDVAEAAAELSERLHSTDRLTALCGPQWVYVEDVRDKLDAALKRLAEGK